MNINKFFKETQFSKEEIYRITKKIMKKELRLSKKKDIYGYNFALIFNSIYLIKCLYRQKGDIELLNTLVSNPAGEGRAIVNKFMKMPAANEAESKFNLNVATYFLEYYFNEKKPETFDKSSIFRHYIYKKKIKNEFNQRKYIDFNISKKEVEILDEFVNSPIFDKNYLKTNHSYDVVDIEEDLDNDFMENKKDITEDSKIEDDIKNNLDEKYILEMKIYDLKDTYNYLQMNGSSKYSFAPDYRAELQKYYNHAASCISKVSKIVNEKNNKVKFCIEDIELIVNKGEKTVKISIDHQWFKISKATFDQLKFKENDTVCIFGKIDLYKKETQKGKEVKDFKINPSKIILYR